MLVKLNRVHHDKYLEVYRYNNPLSDESGSRKDIGGTGSWPVLDIVPEFV
jgi:hypothetical protein